MPDISQLLLAYGLSEKEAAIFLALVKLGISPVSHIARESGITRTHVYDILEALQAKGLVVEGKHRGVKAYEAVDHANLLALISRKQKELKRLEKDMGEAASAFHALAVGGRQKTAVQFFDGAEGIHSIYAMIKSDLQKEKSSFEVLTIFSPGQIERSLPGWFANEEYIDEGPMMTKRAIVYPSPVLDDYVKKMKESKSKHEHRVWKGETGDFSTDTICWKNKITFIDLVDFPSGIVIENTALVASFRMWFENMWSNLTV